MRVILLTSDSFRHKYIAAKLTSQLQLELIITEVKAANIEDTSNLNKEDAAFISAHFAARNKNEIKFFGNFKDFPIDIPLRKIPNGTINSESVATLVDSFQPDYLVLFGTSIIKDPLMEKYSGRILNLHLGLSPYYKGSATNLFPCYYNEPECVGATIHLATCKVDDGPVLHQLRPDIEPEDDLHTIGNKTIMEAGKILPEVIKAFSEKKIIPERQTANGKICRNKNLTPDVLRKIYLNFKEGIIENYLEIKEEKDKQRPIVNRNATINNEQ